MLKNQPYNPRHPLQMWSTTMPRQKTQATPTFGARLAALRKAAGYTQVELAEEIGISQRMVAYYEGQTEYPPTHLLPAIAKALKVTTDELLGVARNRKAAKAARPANTRLQRRIQEIEKLGPREKRQIMQFLDTFLDREKLKRKVDTKQAA
jgi:transcriptional regulator with XRE-family HTH domain